MLDITIKILRGEAENWSFYLVCLQKGIKGSRMFFESDLFALSALQHLAFCKCQGFKGMSA